MTAGFDLVKTQAALNRILCWESVPRSSAALFAFVVGVWFFQIWMIPAALTLLYIRNMVLLTLTRGRENSETLVEMEVEEVEEEVDHNKASTFKQMQDIVLTVQESLGWIASQLESVQNVFNFSATPFLTLVGFAITALVTAVLYFLPVRIIFLVWGVNRMTKKLFRPWSTSSNEILDFLSRVPDNEELESYKPLQLKEKEKKVRERPRKVTL